MTDESIVEQSVREMTLRTFLTLTHIIGFSVSFEPEDSDAQLAERSLRLLAAILEIYPTVDVLVRDLQVTLSSLRSLGVPLFEIISRMENTGLDVEGISMN